MALIPLAEAVALLRCPRCGSAIVPGDCSWHCADDRCRSGSPPFDVLGGRWPVLIDFDDSIVDRSELVAPDAAPTGRAGSRGLLAILRRLIRPRNAVADANISRMLERTGVPDPLVLVVGGGSVGNGVEDIYEDRRTRVLAFDIVPTDHVQFLADAHRIPLASASVDAVVIQAVLEHVLDPGDAVAEIHRVLRPGGLVYAEVPFMQQVHAGPYDFTRFTSSGLRWLFRAFDEIDRGVVAGAGTALSWSLDHWTRSVFRSRTLGRLVRLSAFWLHRLDRLSSAPRSSDGASAHYFLGGRSDRVLRARDMVASYVGAQVPDRPALAGRSSSAPRRFTS